MSNAEIKHQEGPKNPNSMSRRDFLKLTGTATLAFATGEFPTQVFRLSFPLVARDEAQMAPDFTVEMFRDMGLELLSNPHTGMGIEIADNAFVVSESFKLHKNREELMKSTLKPWELIANEWNGKLKGRVSTSPFYSKIESLEFTVDPELGSGARIMMNYTKSTDSVRHIVSFGPDANAIAGTNESGHVLFDLTPLAFDDRHKHLYPVMNETVSNIAEFLGLTRSNTGNPMTALPIQFEYIKSSFDTMQKAFYYSYAPGPDTQAISVISPILLKLYQQSGLRWTLLMLNESLASRVSFPASYNLTDSPHRHKIASSLLAYVLKVKGEQNIPYEITGNHVQTALDKVIADGYIAPDTLLPRNALYQLAIADMTTPYLRETIDGQLYIGQPVHTINVALTDGTITEIPEASTNHFLIAPRITLPNGDVLQAENYKRYNIVYPSGFREKFASYLFLSSQWGGITPTDSKLSFGTTLTYQDNPDSPVLRKSWSHKLQLILPSGYNTASDQAELQEIGRNPTEYSLVQDEDEITMTITNR